ncbi:hypothetical protein V6N13_110930 [Hibiscus sabdariffa]|uniref:Uncharacterized protein n=1 Tax=Hibiscus sabdariffa TaxID=183260 RepID=A0ABR1ZTZ9_9ROSI
MPTSTILRAIIHDTLRIYKLLSRICRRQKRWIFLMEPVFARSSLSWPFKSQSSQKHGSRLAPLFVTSTERLLLISPKHGWQLVNHKGTTWDFQLIFLRPIIIGIPSKILKEFPPFLLSNSARSSRISPAM